LHKNARDVNVKVYIM